MIAQAAVCYLNLVCNSDHTLSGNTEMGSLKSKVRAQGASVVTTLPAEVARRLGIEAGAEVEWIEDGLGGFRMVRSEPRLDEVMKVHDRIMEEYGSVFRALAR